MRLYFAPFSLCTGRGALVLMAECSDLRTCRFYHRMWFVSVRPCWDSHSAGSRLCPIKEASVPNSVSIEIKQPIP